MLVSLPLFFVPLQVDSPCCGLHVSSSSQLRKCLRINIIRALVRKVKDSAVHVGISYPCWTLPTDRRTNLLKKHHFTTRQAENSEILLTPCVLSDLCGEASAFPCYRRPLRPALPCGRTVASASTRKTPTSTLDSHQRAKAASRLAYSSRRAASACSRCASLSHHSIAR